MSWFSYILAILSSLFKMIDKKTLSYGEKKRKKRTSKE